jgi:hypothetical protein
MQKKRRSTGLVVARIREARIGALWLKRKPRGALAGAACVLLSLALAACGGSVDGDSAPVSKGRWQMPRQGVALQAPLLLPLR